MMGAWLACAGLLGWFTTLCAYDIRMRRLPNWLTLPGGLIVLVCAAVSGRGAAAVLGAAALTLLYLVIHLAMPAGMGAGDVKLAIGVGALTGAFGVDSWMLATLAAPILTSLWALVVAVRGSGEGAVPHGPSMCVAAATAAALVYV